MFIGRISISKTIPVLFVLLFHSAFVIAQRDTVANDPNEAYKILNNHNKFYAGLNFGLYQFYGDVGTDKVFAGSMMKGKFPYMISPRIGYDFNERFGLRSSFGMGEIWAQSNKESMDFLYFKSSVRDLQAHFCINMTNLISPYFYNKKWYMNINIGAGYMWYRSLTKNNADEIQDFYGYDTFGNKESMWSTILWSGGATFGFKIAKHTDINLELQAYKPVTDYLDGVSRSLSEMDIYSSVSIGINYYFGKKEQEWKWNPMDYVIRGIYDTLAKHEKTIASLNTTVIEIKEEYADTAKLHDSDRDSVPDFKDMEPNSPQGAMVNWQGKQILIIDTMQLVTLIQSLNVKTDIVSGYAGPVQKEKEDDHVIVKPSDEIVGYAFLFSSVYFPFDMATIDIPNYKEIVRVAQYMMAHQQVKILISGNCDKIGPDSYNDALALRRTSAVKKVLTEDFNISSERISEESNSNKKLLSKSVDEVNRRVDFFIIQ